VTEQISQRELRNDSGRIMRALAEGHSFIVSRNGRPVGELRPLRRDRFVPVETVTDIFQNAPPIDGVQWRRDLDELAGQGIDPRG
jgi:antitoxin (DNA-binding transcriptional repressor) of toxin-antitoxin stability system